MIFACPLCLEVTIELEPVFLHTMLSPASFPIRSILFRTLYRPVLDEAVEAIEARRDDQGKGVERGRAHVGSLFGRVDN